MNRAIPYWISTSLLAFAMFGGGVVHFAQPEEGAKMMGELLLPAYFGKILGGWKLLAIIALLAPGFPKVKEWAYAGIFFTLTGAFVSHLAAGHAVAQAVPPLVVLAIAATSYFTRPASRQLAAETSIGQLATA